MATNLFSFEWNEEQIVVFVKVLSSHSFFADDATGSDSDSSSCPFAIEMVWRMVQNAFRLSLTLAFMSDQSRLTIKQSLANLQNSFLGDARDNNSPPGQKMLREIEEALT